MAFSGGAGNPGVVARAIRAILELGGSLVSATNPLPVYVPTPDYDWVVEYFSEETLNDSDKSFTVPADTEWQILSLWVELTTTGTAGDRQLVIQTQDGSADVTGEPIRVGVTQAASLTYKYMLGPALADLTALRDTDWLMSPIPPTLILPAAHVLRVYDNNAVDAAADDMIVHGYRAVRSV